MLQTNTAQQGPTAGTNRQERAVRSKKLGETCCSKVLLRTVSRRHLLCPSDVLNKTLSFTTSSLGTKELYREPCTHSHPYAHKLLHKINAVWPSGPPLKTDQSMQEFDQKCLLEKNIVANGIVGLACHYLQLMLLRTRRQILEDGATVENLRQDIETHEAKAGCDEIGRGESHGKKQHFVLLLPFARVLGCLWDCPRQPSIHRKLMIS